MSRLGAACLLLLLASPALRSAGPIDLHWQLKKGQVLKYLLKHREVRTVNVADQKFETTTTTDYDWQWTVQEVDDQGTATLELKVKGLRMTCNGKDFDFQYDSSRANQSDDDYKMKLIAFYNEVRFGSYRLKLRRDGTIAEVNGFDKLINELSPGGNVVDFHGLNLHDDSFGWFLQLLLGTLPEKALPEGSEWKVPVRAKLAGFGDLNGQIEVTLGKEVKVGERSCRELKQTGSEMVDLDMKWANGSLRGTLKTTKLTGLVRFDPRAGAVQSGEAQADYGGELKLGLGEMPVVLGVKFHQELTLEAQP
jgi:hypothetical protein